MKMKQEPTALFRDKDHDWDGYFYDPVRDIYWRHVPEKLSTETDT